MNWGSCSYRKILINSFFFLVFSHSKIFFYSYNNNIYFLLFLQAPPPSRSSPERDSEVDFVAVDAKPMALDAETVCGPNPCHLPRLASLFTVPA